MREVIDFVYRKCLFFVSLTIFASSVVIEKTDKDFNIYWNIPTFQCRPHKIYFYNFAGKYGLIQNKNDSFRGEEIAILYDPGDFPAILEESGTGNLFLRNGGVPQEGNLSLHLEIFRQVVDELIPNNNFSGIGVIDFESWRPIFRQNFAALQPYKDLSYKVETSKHPSWPKADVVKEATKNFELFGRDFMEETLYMAKEMRPNATWGYYAYPYCFNMSPNTMNTMCSDEVKQENDRTQWLFSASGAFHPSIYLSEMRLTSKQMVQLIEGRLIESRRIIGNLNKVFAKPKILPYMWLKYRDTKQYMSKEDLSNTIMILKALNADGVIIWGSSEDVNSRKNCQMLYDYVDSTLGPIVDP